MNKIYFLTLAILLTSCYQQAKWIFSPTPLDPNYKYKFEQNFTEFNLEVEEDRTLNVLHFKVEKPKGLIFYCHGNDGTLKDWGTLAKDFLRHEYDIVMMDYPGYGKSEKKITTQKSLYSDMQLLYDSMKTQYTEQNIVLYGRSIGTGIVSSLVVNNNPKLLILETPYYNLKKLTRYYADAPVPMFWVRWGLDNNKHILATDIPVYIFHGTDDEIIPYEQGLELSKLREGIEFTTFDKGMHNDLRRFELYHERLKEILASSN